MTTCPHCGEETRSLIRCEHCIALIANRCQQVILEGKRGRTTEMCPYCYQQVDVHELVQHMELCRMRM